MDVDIPMPQPPDAQHAQSEASTQAPSVAQEPENSCYNSHYDTKRTTATPATSRRPSGIRVDEGPGGRLTSTFGPMCANNEVNRRCHILFQDQHLQHGLHHRQARISTTYFRTMTPRKCSGSTSSPERIPCLYLLTRPPMSSRMHVA